MKEIYGTVEYFVQLQRRVEAAGAGDRVAVATMAFSPEEPVIGELVGALCAAAGRGAQVRVVVDAYTFLLNEKGNQVGPMFFNRELGDKLPVHYQAVRDALQELERFGAKTGVTNRPKRAFTNPFAGRSHLKFAVVNNDVFLGGCNLDSGVQLDMMAGWEDRRSADWLWELSGRMIESGSTLAAVGGEDMEYVVDETSSIIVDAGISGKSLIFDRALELIDEAEERLLMTCQFFPNDTTAKRLLAAYQRGVEVEIIYNHPSKHPVPNNLLHHGVERAAKLTLPKSFFVHALPTENNFLHAKLLVSEKAAIVGSHNLVTAGIRLGTAEIALEERDSEFGRRAVVELRSQIGKIA